MGGVWEDNHCLTLSILTGASLGGGGGGSGRGLMRRAVILVRGGAVLWGLARNGWTQNVHHNIMYK